MRLVMVCNFVALGSGPAALAQSAPDAFDLCARQQDPNARLACFDLQIAARRAANSAGAASAPSPAKAAVPASSAVAAGVAANPVPATAAESTVGLDAQQLHKLHPETAKPAPVVIEAKVVAVIPRRSLISAFELDNGQVWEQAETVDGLWIKPKEIVTIHEGAMGGFLLKSADGHVFRVKRVK
jgi:hypothetical protein